MPLAPNVQIGSATSARNVQAAWEMTISAVAATPAALVPSYATAAKGAQTVPLFAKGAVRLVPTANRRRFVRTAVSYVKTAQRPMKSGARVAVPAEAVPLSVNAAAAVIAVPLSVRVAVSNAKTVRVRSVPIAATASVAQGIPAGARTVMPAENA